LRTIKVIIQHVVAHYGDEVYDQLSTAFDDPSATIVYPYVYRILNSNARAAENKPPSNGSVATQSAVQTSLHSKPSMSLSSSSAASASSHAARREPSPEPVVPSDIQSSSQAPLSSSSEDPDALLIKIIGHISSETTGALHKEGITELHQFIKAYPHKKAKVDKLLEATGPAFRKYIARALASRAVEDQEREVAVADTLSRLETTRDSAPSSPLSKSTSSPRRTSVASDHLPGEDRLSKLHDVFHYRRNAAAREDNRVSRSSMIHDGSPPSAGLPGARAGSSEQLPVLSERR